LKEKVRITISLICISGIFFAWILLYVNLAKINNTETARIWVYAPSIVESGKEFEITVQAWDKWEQLSIQYDQEINLKDYILEDDDKGTIIKNDDEGSYKFPNNLKFKPSLIQDRYLSTEYYLLGGNKGGSITISDIVLKKEGLHYLKVESADGLYSYSNPILVLNKADKYLYWGDIHGHTDLSDGSGTPEFAYKYARDIACLDFASITDHDSALLTGHLGGYLFDVAAANNYNDPNDFVTLVAYEWTRGFGYSHVNVYYKGEDGPLYSFLDPKYDTTNKLLQGLKEWKEEDPERDVIAIPHHPTSSQNYVDWSYDWRDIDPDLMPLVEIYSVHGQGEMTKEDGNLYELSYLRGGYYAMGDGYHVQSALAMGYRLGLMCSSDTHDARLGHSILHVDNYGASFPYATLEFFRAALPFPSCLTGCWAKELTRASIFESFKARKVFGSTHVSRPIIQFSINGVSPGDDDSTIKLPTSTSQRIINLTVAIDGNYEDNSIKSIEIVKNNKNWVIYDKNGLYYYNKTKIKTLNYDDRKYISINIVDTEPIEGMKYDDGEMVNGKGYLITGTADNYFDEQPSTDGVDVYYVRVHDSFDAEGWNWREEVDWKGNLAWCGPLWVEINA